ACHRLARLVGRGGTIIELLVGFAIDVTTARADAVFIDRAQLTSARAQACRRDLERLPPMPTVAEKVDRYERFMLLDILMQTVRQGPSFLQTLSDGRKAPSSRDRFVDRLFTQSLDFDPAFQKANAWYDRFAAVLRLTDRHERRQESQAITADLRRARAEL